MSSAITNLTKIGYGASDPVDKFLNVMDFDLGVSKSLKDTNGIRGTFFKDGNRFRHNRTTVEPRFRCEPTAAELAPLLEWIMGGTPTGSGTITYPWSNTTATRYVHIAPVAGEEFGLSGVGVDTASFSAASGDSLTLSLGLLGQTAIDTESSFPNLTPDQTSQPFLLSDLALTFGGSTRSVRQFTIEVNRGLDRSRFLNSLTLTRVQSLMADFRITISVPSGDNASLWSAGIDGVAFTATFTNPNNNAALVFSSPDVRFQAQTPTFDPNAEGFLQISGELCRTSGTANPLTITLNQGS